MALWFAAIVGIWLALSVVVSLGMARAIHLSSRPVSLVPASTPRGQGARPAIPTQTRRTDARVLTSVNRLSA